MVEVTDLIQRCASLGWTLRPDGDGYELLGNGAPAAFRSAESVEAWLSKQEKGRKDMQSDPDQAPLLNALPMFAYLESEPA